MNALASPTLADHKKAHHRDSHYVVMHYSPIANNTLAFGVALDGQILSTHSGELDALRHHFVDSFLDLRQHYGESDDSALFLYISDTKVRRLIDEAVEGIAHIHVVHHLTGSGFAPAWESLRNALDNLSKPATGPASPDGALDSNFNEPLKAENNVRIIATDASKGRSSSLCGIAYATNKGEVVVSTVKAGKIESAEFQAVELAIRHRASSKRPLKILTDSRTVANTLNGRINYQGPAAKSCIAVLKARLCAGHKVTIEWVRGHNGHVLNDIADRAAVATRRNAQWGLDKTVTRAAIINLRKELRQRLGQGESCEALTTSQSELGLASA